MVELIRRRTAAGGRSGSSRPRRAGLPAAERVQRGFTLLEVTVAIGIMAFGLLGLMAMQLHAMRGGTQGRHTTAATSIAQSRMEDLHRMDFAGLAQTAAWVPVGGQMVNTTVQANPANQVEQTYNLQWRITDINAQGTLKALDVRVTWAEPNRPQRNVTISTIRHDDPVSRL